MKTEKENDFSLTELMSSPDAKRVLAAQARRLENQEVQHRQMLERQKKEYEKNIIVRCRNLSLSRLSKEFHYVNIEVVLNKKIMKHSNHVVEDLDFEKKLLLYCETKKINIH